MSDVKAKSRQDEIKNGKNVRVSNGRSPRPSPLLKTPDLFETGPAASLRGPVPVPLTKPAIKPAFEPQTSAPSEPVSQEEPADQKEPITHEKPPPPTTPEPPVSEPVEAPQISEEPKQASDAVPPPAPSTDSIDKETAQNQKMEETTTAKVETTPSTKTDDAEPHTDQVEDDTSGAGEPAVFSEGAPSKSETPADPQVAVEDEKKREEKTPEEVSEKKGEKAEGDGSGQEEAAVERAPTTPEEDPDYQKTMRQIKRTKKQQGKHQPPAAKTDEVKKAAILPESEQTKKNDRQKHLDTMNQVAENKEKEGKSFKAETFKQLLQENLTEIGKNLPQSESDAKRFKREKPLDGVRKNINAKVQAENQKVAAPVTNQVKHPEPPSSGLPTQAPQPLQEELPGKQPRNISSKAAAPKPKYDSEVSMKKESQSLDDKMKEQNMTEEQLAQSNEPQFIEALSTKKQAQKEADAAPSRYRGQEKQILDNARNRAGGTGRRGFGGMFNQRQGSFTQVFTQQGKTEKDDKTQQEIINKELEGIYNKTKDDVNKILENLTTDVDAIFSTRVKSAQKSFEKRVESQLDDIYGITVIDDWIFGEDTEAIEKVFRNEKTIFVSKMDKALTDIANLIARQLNAAIARIKFGRKEAQTFYDRLDKEQKRLAKESMDFFKAQYDNLEDSVHEKQRELAHTLAAAYQKNVSELRKSFDKIKDEVSKGWIGKAVEFIVDVGKAIAKLASLLWSVLSRLGDLIGDILAHPIRFLKNLASGIKAGFKSFVKDIDKHLIAGFFDWIRGSLSEGEIKIPKKLDASGLFSLTTQVLGLTYDTFRKVAVRKYGEKVVSALEKGGQVAGKGLELIQLARTKGLGALWDHIKSMIADQLGQIFEKVKETVLYETIKKALAFIASMFTPAGAFIKAAQTLYRGLRFLVDNIDRIAKLVNAFMDSLELAVKGNVEGIAKKIVQALKVFIVIAIDFLAKLLGLGKLADKVRRILRALRKPIVRAMEWLLDKLKPIVNRIFGAGKKIVSKTKAGAQKLKELIFPNKRFKVGKELHVVRVVKAGKKHQIRIRSQERDPTTFIKLAQDKEKENPNKELRANITKLQQDHKDWESMKEDSETKKKKKVRKYSKIGGLIAKIMNQMGSDKPAEKSEISWNYPDSRGRTKGVTATKLTHKGEDGSPPKSGENPPGWLTRDKAGSDLAKKGLIRAHLIHHDLHGPGTVKNLTPTSSKTNQLMYNRVERHALKAVKSNRTLTYSTKVTYDDSQKEPIKDFAKRIETEATDKESGVKIGSVSVDNY